jgi:hypothetical protein
MVFRGPNDLGIKFNNLFNPAGTGIPPRVIAFACALVCSEFNFLANYLLTVLQINNIIDEFTSGHHECTPTHLEDLRRPFNMYLGSLEQLKIANPPRYNYLLERIYDKCM